jgi:type III restriction enzyme
MDNLFFEHPILNSPYDYPGRHWELDGQGQPTQQIVEPRRRAEFITPIPKPIVFRFRVRAGRRKHEKPD